MANVRDIGLEADDLFINPNTGDFEALESDSQHVKDITESYLGWWKEFPTLGVGAKKFLGSSGGVQKLKSKIQIALKADGYKVQKVSVIGNQLYIAGERVIK